MQDMIAQPPLIELPRFVMYGHVPPRSERFWLKGDFYHYWQFDYYNYVEAWAMDLRRRVVYEPATRRCWIVAEEDIRRTHRKRTDQAVDGAAADKQASRQGALYCRAWRMPDNGAWRRLSPWLWFQLPERGQGQLLHGGRFKNEYNFLKTLGWHADKQQSWDWADNCLCEHLPHPYCRSARGFKVYCLDDERTSVWPSFFAPGQDLTAEHLGWQRVERLLAHSNESWRIASCLLSLHRSLTLFEAERRCGWAVECVTEGFRAQQLRAQASEAAPLEAFSFEAEVYNLDTFPNAQALWLAPVFNGRTLQELIPVSYIVAEK